MKEESFLNTFWNKLCLKYYFWLSLNRAEGQNQKSQKFNLSIVPLKKTIFASIHSDESLTVGSQKVDKTFKVKSIKFGSICESAPDLKLSIIYATLSSVW